MSNLYKMQILSFLITLQKYDDLPRFFDFLLKMKQQHHLTKDQLQYILLETHAEDETQSTLACFLIEDCLDYFTGYHSPLMPSHFAYEFVKALNQ